MIGFAAPAVDFREMMGGTDLIPRGECPLAGAILLLDFGLALGLKTFLCCSASHRLDASHRQGPNEDQSEADRCREQTPEEADSGGSLVTWCYRHSFTASAPALLKPDVSGPDRAD
jgi:hypothetical protein